MRRMVGLVSGVLFLAGCVTGVVTPLHEAVRDGRMSLARAELTSGANVDAVDEEGRTPLHYACATGDTAMAELLLEAGAATDLPDREGNTPLHYAATNCYTAIVRMLVAAGADTSLINAAGRTAAEETECPETARALE